MMILLNRTHEYFRGTINNRVGCAANSLATPGIDDRLFNRLKTNELGTKVST